MRWLRCLGRQNGIPKGGLEAARRWIVNLRFDNIIGAAADKVPAGATILSAKLNIHTGANSGDETTGIVELHRMLVPWSELSTWNSLGGGISTDGVEAVGTAEFTLQPDQEDISAIFDVTSTVQAWANGSTNNGWALLAGSTNGWRFGSSELGTMANRPSLEVTYVVPEPGIGLFVLMTLLGVRRRW